jgi:hypothetical protein
MKLFLLFTSLFSFQVAQCCSCIHQGKIDEKQYDEYQLIAKGKIIKVAEHRYLKVIFLQISTLYKVDKQEKVIMIISPKDEGLCGIIPRYGEVWLMFAYKDGKSFKTDLCTRTKNMDPKAWNYRKDELEADLKFLEEKRKAGDTYKL